ncbi:hypothetical protein EDB83DRAFT_2447472 [Lactarius deliciosus]|nr:hypothetical protein EDB83DRAFT_2447472 [Lactarius deliciosus]
MYTMRHLNCSKSSVLSGINWFSKLRTTTIGRWCPGSSNRSATFTYLYIRTPILRQHASPPPYTIGRFCFCHRRATSLAILITLPPNLLALSCMIIPRWSPPLPVPMHLPRPYPPHFVTTSKASRMCRHLTPSTPLIRQLSKASAFMLPHQLRSLLALYRTLSTQV